MSPPNLKGIVASPKWMADAECKQSDPELFYPDTGHSSRDGRAVCARCPVEAECLAYAIEHHERYGVWGGMSERQRRHMREIGGRSIKRTQTNAREQPWHQWGPDKRESVVRRLAATLTDAQIGARLGCHRKTVLAFRTATGIPPAYPRIGGWIKS